MQAFIQSLGLTLGKTTINTCSTSENNYLDFGAAEAQPIIHV